MVCPGVARIRRYLRCSEARLLGARGRPKFNLTYYAVNKRGEFGAASLYPGQFAVHDGSAAKLADTAHLYDAQPR